MKKITIVFLLFTCSLMYGQSIWSSDGCSFAKHKYYANLGLGWASPRGGGNILSIAPEIGRILGKHTSIGLSGRLMFYGGDGLGSLINLHPYIRCQTAFPSAIPNLFVDIGSDFRRRTYDGGTSTTYALDFGIRPGIIIRFTDFFSFFMMGTFSGYQWSRADGTETGNWKAFRFDYFDHCVGVSFFF